jgi:hypothetical protein
MRLNELGAAAGGVAYPAVSAYPIGLHRHPGSGKFNLEYLDTTLRLPPSGFPLPEPVRSIRH